MAVNKNFVVKNGLEVDTNLIVADANTNKVGIGSTTPRVELDVRGGIAATDISISGVGTIVTLQSTAGTVTNLSGTNLNYSGIGTVGTVLASSANISGITTTTSLNVSGIATIAVGIVTNLGGTNLNYSGIATANSISIGATQVISNERQLQNIVSLDATTTSTIETAIANAPNTFTDLRVTGISTLGTVLVSSGVITATSGIVTYYGDGAYLQNISAGVGIGTSTGLVGYGVTFLNFFGPGVSTAYYSSTTGIATIYFAGGGGSASIGIGSTPGDAFTGIITAGNLWYNSNLGRLFIYYQDNDSAQWVDAAPFNIGVLSPVSIALTSGTASAPSLSFSGDTSTGLFQATPGQQTFVSSGASVLNVNPGGVNVTGVTTSSGGFVGTLTGNVTGNINSTGVSTFASLRATNINTTGVTTSSGGFVGDVTGNATGLSGTPNVTVGFITATEYDITGSTNTLNASGLNVGVATATTFIGAVTGDVTGNATGLSGTPNITVGNIVGAALTLSGNLTVNGTQTIINTQTLEVADKTIGIGSTSSPSDALADGAGIVVYGTTNKSILWQDNSDSFTFSDGIDIKGAVETVSVGATYALSGGRVVLECDAQNGTVFTHNIANGQVGIVSLRNFPATKNSVTTYTILFTQASTAPTGGIGNTTVGTGIGTNITLTPLGVAGFTTSARVATASTVTLSTTADDVDIVSFAVHYNGSGTGTVGNYRVLASGTTGFRFGNVGF